MTTHSSAEQFVPPSEFFLHLSSLSLAPFVGVPCSLISSLISYAVDHPSVVEYVHPVHESHAMAYAAGTYMSTGKVPVVFMQNSGFGNIINPLTSLHQIYDIPAVILVTWRAEKGYGTDAPEHWIVGRDMEKYFATFDLPYKILSPLSWRDDIRTMAEVAQRTRKPAVICVRKGLFAPYESTHPSSDQHLMTSHHAIEVLKQSLQDSVYLSTTGMISRESFTVRDTPDFYMMGSMGLISGIAIGASMHSKKHVVCLDGDGALLMHLGLMPFIGYRSPRRFLHVVLDNQAYSSTGGQPTVSPRIDFPAVALASGYTHALTVQDETALRATLQTLPKNDGPVLLHIRVQNSSNHHIGRVSDMYTCPQVTDRFSEAISRP